MLLPYAKFCIRNVAFHGFSKRPEAGSILQVVHEVVLVGLGVYDLSIRFGFGGVIFIHQLGFAKELEAPRISILETNKDSKNIKPVGYLARGRTFIVVDASEC